MRNKFILYLTSVLLCANIFCPIKASATSYENLDFIVYEENVNIAFVAPNGLYLSTSMQLVFDSGSTPPSSIFVTKTVDGVTYKGNLNLTTVERRNNKIYATYSGILLAEDQYS